MAFKKNWHAAYRQYLTPDEAAQIDLIDKTLTGLRRSIVDLVERRRMIVRRATLRGWKLRRKS